MTLPPRTRKKKLDAQRNRCYYCGELLEHHKVEIDHILPFRKNRDGTVKNLCLACKPCNRAKGEMDLENFKEILKNKNLLTSG